MKNIIILTVSLLLFWNCNQGSEKTENHCKCPIVENVDVKTEKGRDSFDQSWVVGANGDVEAAVKKAVDAKISISGSYSNSNSKIEEVYSEIIVAKPQITQKANLYRSIACAYYEIVCQDISLSPQQKTSKLQEVVASYEKNIHSILIEENKPIERKGTSSTNHKSGNIESVDENQSIPTPKESNSLINKKLEEVKEPSIISNKEKKIVPPVHGIVLEHDNVNYEWKGCKRQGENFKITILTTSNEDKQIRVSGNNYSDNSTMAYDDLGNSYKVDLIKMGNQTVNTVYGQKILQETPTEMVLIFKGLETVLKPLHE